MDADTDLDVSSALEKTPEAVATVNLESEYATLPQLDPHEGASHASTTSSRALDDAVVDLELISMQLPQGVKESAATAMTLLSLAAFSATSGCSLEKETPKFSTLEAEIPIAVERVIEERNDRVELRDSIRESSTVLEVFNQKLERVARDEQVTEWLDTQPQELVSLSLAFSRTLFETSERLTDPEYRGAISQVIDTNVALSQFSSMVKERRPFEELKIAGKNLVKELNELEVALDADISRMTPAADAQTLIGDMELFHKAADNLNREVQRLDSRSDAEASAPYNPNVDVVAYVGRCVTRVHEMQQRRYYHSMKDELGELASLLTDVQGSLSDPEQLNLAELWRKEGFGRQQFLEASALMQAIRQDFKTELADYGVVEVSDTNNVNPEAEKNQSEVKNRSGGFVYIAHPYTGGGYRYYHSPYSGYSGTNRLYSSGSYKSDYMNARSESEKAFGKSSLSKSQSGRHASDSHAMKSGKSGGGRSMGLGRVGARFSAVS